MLRENPIHKEIVRELVELDPSIHKNKQRIVFNGLRKRTIPFFEEVIFPIIQKKKFNDAALLDKEGREDYTNMVIDDCRRAIKSEKVKELRKKTQNFYLELDPEGFMLMVDLEDNSEFLFDAETSEIPQGLDHNAWLRFLDKDTKEGIMDSIRPAKRVYDPYDLAPVKTIEEKNITYFEVNTYIPPKWRKEPPENEFVECPEVLDRFLDHLFPIAEERRYIENWLFNALMNRNEVYLVLNGFKGVGKNVFTDLLKALVGRKNFSEAPIALLKEKFNSVLDEKRVVVLDEFKVGKSEHTRLKRFINKYQNLESKGVDASAARETFNSYVICNNDLTDMFLEYDDRRFSVPYLPKVGLLEVFDKDEITNLVAEFENEDSQLVKDFGYYIYFNGEDTNLGNFHTIKNKRFYQLVYTSLTEWQKYLVDTILSREESEYRLHALRKKYSKDNPHGSKIPHNIAKVADFLNNYRHEGIYELGHISKEGRENFLIPADDFLPIDSEDDDEGESIL